MKKNNSITDSQLHEIWNEVPVDYYEDGEKNNVGQKLWHSNKRRVFKKLLVKYNLNGQDKLRILDLGCADGHLTAWLRSEFEGSEIYGLDSTPKLIAAAKKKYKKIHFEVGDAHKLKYLSNFFDLVLCSEVLEHVVDPVKVCTEIARVLKPDGYIFMELDTGSPLFLFLWFFWTRFGAGRVWKSAHLHQFSAYSLPLTMKKGGLNPVHQENHHLRMATTVVAQRKVSNASKR